MGVKHFFLWFKRKYGSYVHPIYGNSPHVRADIDCLLLDMNGIYHSVAQKVYKYGAHAETPVAGGPGSGPSLLGHKLKKQLNKQSNNQLKPHDSPDVIPSKKKLYVEICKEVLHLLKIVKPNKKLIMCVDGPAPLGKQAQQRSRRFRSAYPPQTSDSSSTDQTSKPPFDPTQFTPGTKLMYELSAYIDWYIRRNLDNNTNPWATLEIIFSSERVPGEGEQKILNHVRKYGDPTHSYCIYGMDADLIMLAMLSRMERFYVLREDNFDAGVDFYLVDVKSIRTRMAQTDLCWSNPRLEYSKRSAIDDFVLICFLVGNDFLPQIPSLEIFQGGLDLLIEIYVAVGSSLGHLTLNNYTSHHGNHTPGTKDNLCGLRINFKTLSKFLKICGSYEKQNLEKKVTIRNNFFPDPLLESVIVTANPPQIDIDQWIDQYFASHFSPDISRQEICMRYLKGMEWVLLYYTWGVLDWYWSYGYDYAPPASQLAKFSEFYELQEQSTSDKDSFSRSLCKISSIPYNLNIPPSRPTAPFLQLLCVLPPASSYLLPKPMGDLLSNPDSPLAPFCPTSFVVDLSGKRKEWEGIAILPTIDFELVYRLYKEILPQVSLHDRQRNSFSYTVFYSYSVKNPPVLFKSYYGDLQNSKVTVIRMT